MEDKNAPSTSAPNATGHIARLLDYYLQKYLIQAETTEKEIKIMTARLHEISDQSKRAHMRKIISNL
ncbi:MAG: hypothetical protein WCT40_04795 [Candidatus Magasanikbacteria bacterium]